MDREKRIVRTSVIGIAANLVLVLFKMAVGFLTNSIAVVLDAVNNLSDALSSVITIVGTRLANRAPDRKHPYGHGRVEYLTSVLIAVIVLLAGLTSLKESAEKVFHPVQATYTPVSLVIIAVAVAAKVLIGRYVSRVGREINSGSLVASGADALFDAVLSFATLVAAVVNLVWGVGLEGILGVVISAFIIKAGVGMLRETLDSIIGTRTEHELSEAIKALVCARPEVHGAYDLILHNYGPTRMIGSVHIEVDDELTARDLHALTRRISAEVYEKFGVILTVGIYASGNSSEELTALRRTVEELAAADPAILQVHGFYGDSEQKWAMFDLIVDFKADAEAVRDRLLQELSRRYGEYRLDIVLDSDYSD